MISQPELGKKIFSLREAKGMTQEELADICKINVRTIQRIENGQVEPRMNTLKLIGDTLDFNFNDITDNQNMKIWLLIMHLTSIIPLIIPPLIIWMAYKDHSPEFDRQGKEVINFQISATIYLLIASVLVFAVIGILLLPIMGISIFFISILQAIRSINNEFERYPLTIRFIK